MDLASLAASLTRLGAPIIGGALGGPAGAGIASTVVESLAKAFDVEPTPEAVEAALEKADAPIIVRRVEAAEAPAIMDEVNAYIRDVQDARATTVKLVEQGSSIAWGAPVVSVIVLIGFSVISYLAIYAPPQQREVLLFLLGAWSSLATGVVGYWVGSSAGSKSKDDALIRIMAASPVAKARGR
jgi:hypothetical protein